MMKKQVLVVCSDNSACGQMVEAIINTRCTDEWEAVSAGTDPRDQINAFALQVLKEIGIDIGTTSPKSVSAFIGHPFDKVITVCESAAEVCPDWPEQGERVHMNLPDPEKVEGDDEAKLAAFRFVRDDVERRILMALDG
jgi:arsenate reductase (thioredoxin)